jgi:hypothetical protein
VRLSGRIKFAPRGPRLNSGPLARRIYVDPLHRSQVDHHPVIAYGVAADPVPAAVHGYFETVIARVIDGRDDIPRSRAARDKRGPTVDGAIVNSPQDVVLRISGADEFANEFCAELVGGELGHRVLLGCRSRR